MDGSTTAEIAALAVAPRQVKLKDLFGDIFPADAGERMFEVRPATPDVPKLDPRYQFELDELRLLLMWDSPRVRYNRNLMLTGPKGCGKSELAFQFAARTGREVFRYSCHERTELADLLGGMVILQDGSTAWQDGPLVRAYRAGALFVLDEVNAARPGSLIGLNGVMDGAESISLPTGEIVRRHPDFRVAVTGNSIVRDSTAASYKGTGAMNAAFLSRCFKIEKTYLSAVRETKLLHDYLSEATSDPVYNPAGVAVPAQMLGLVVGYCNKVREQFMRGELEVTISTRELLAMCEIVAMRWNLVVTNPPEQLLFAARATIFGSATGAMQMSLEKGFRAEVIDSQAWVTELMRGSAASGATPRVVRLVLLGNPKSLSSNDATVWGYVVEGDGQAKSFNGSLTKGRLTWSKVKTVAEMQVAEAEKLGSRGYQQIIETDLAIPEGHSMEWLRQLPKHYVPGPSNRFAASVGSALQAAMPTGVAVLG